MARWQFVFAGWLLLGALAMPTGAAAGGGEIVGFVFDQLGTPLARVKLTATSAEAPSVRAETFSDQEGRFHFTGLRPGRFTVEARAPGLRPVVQRDILVGAAQAEVNMIMDAPGRREEVVVLESGAGPRVISPATADSKESYDAEFLEALPPSARGFVTEAYDHLEENPFFAPADTPLSTFGIDVDTASYSNVRRFLASGAVPPPGAVRLEEMLNYFPYEYPPPRDDTPFATSFEIAACPWNPDARLVRIGLRGREIPPAQRPPANLVFLVDVSGSMDRPEKLPLVRDALKLLVGALRSDDRIALVVYAGATGVALPSTPVSARADIIAAIDSLTAGGSTNGGAGITLAYQIARKAFRKGGNNRVVLATDGDFNVGVTSQDELVELIKKEAATGVFLTVLGFGMGNLKDATMEKLADHGNGNYAYIDNEREAHKVLVAGAAGTLVTIAKDVKIQVELNPARVGAYRLLGYENRLLRKQDFNDDRKDAGEIGVGHTVTALYEVVPPGPASARLTGTVDRLRYTSKTASNSPELMTVKIRYKDPDGATSRKLEWSLPDQPAAAASPDLRFASAVAAFALVLRASPHRGQADLALVERLLAAGLGTDPGGYRREFAELVASVRALPAQVWAERLQIERPRETIALSMSGARLHGEVRGTPFEIRIAARRLEGHVGGEPVGLWLRGREATGHVGGVDVGYTVLETPTGHLLRGKSWDSTVRLEESHGTLAWLPGCDEPLVRLPRTSLTRASYQGTCATGDRVRLELPAALEALPALPRLVLLSLLLNEPEGAGRRRLFTTKGAR